MAIRDRIKSLRRVRAGDLVADPRNWRRHPETQQAALRGILEEIGYADALLARELPDGRLGLVDGHLRKGLDPDQKVPVLVLDLDEAESRKLMTVLDPLAAMAEADEQALESLLLEIDTESEGLRALLDELAKEHGIDAAGEPTPDPEPQIDRAAELAKEWGTARGQVWEIEGKAGTHRVMCGDSTCKEDVERLMGGNQIGMMVSDPPYCSGGFQEAGKKAGSVGTRGDELIRNDQLSTRGYQALIHRVLEVSSPTLAYVFTDWRMWVVLFDVVESVGLGVKAMIVWDKQTPGMGRGWRHQHELIMCGSRESQPFDLHKAQGDVIQCKRTGNKLHATEKPIELIGKILAVSDIHPAVYDPFLGSGTTLIAAESLGRVCYGMEIDPGYVAVTLQRGKDAGMTPKLTTDTANGKPRRKRKAVAV